MSRARYLAVFGTAFLVALLLFLVVPSKGPLMFALADFFSCVGMLFWTWIFLAIIVAVCGPWLLGVLAKLVFVTWLDSKIEPSRDLDDAEIAWLGLPIGLVIGILYLIVIPLIVTHNSWLTGAFNTFDISTAFEMGAWQWGTYALIGAWITYYSVSD
ncbi:MAG: hypothetical protein ABH814_03185 [bacterium]